MITKVMDKADIDYLKALLLDENNQLKIISYELLKDVPDMHIVQFCVENGFYNLPTIELVDYLKQELGTKIKRTIEIGAGNGIMAKALNITATDSYQQERSDMKLLYTLSLQKPVQYGDNVLRYDALSAIKLLKPEIVMGAWVAHIWNPMEHWREGNQFGVDFKYLLKRVKKLILIGNDEVHSKNPIMDLPHQTLKFDWLVSRGFDKSKNAIYIWEK